MVDSLGRGRVGPTEPLTNRAVARPGRASADGQGGVTAMAKYRRGNARQRVYSSSSAPAAGGKQPAAELPGSALVHMRLRDDDRMTKRPVSPS